jgi:arylsulfatase A-like enzyme
MIIITSDHGEQFYEHSGWNHGYNLYQEVLKVPLIIKFPFGVYAATKVSTAVSLVDIMPTIISVTNSMKKNLKLDGINLIDVIKKKKINRMIISDVSADIMFYHNPKRVCLINDSMKLIYNDKISNDDYAFFKYPPPVPPEIELYDLINDSYEKNNLVSFK